MTAHRFRPLGARNGQRFLVARYANEILHMHQRPMQSVPGNVPSAPWRTPRPQRPCSAPSDWHLPLRLKCLVSIPAQWQDRVETTSSIDWSDRLLPVLLTFESVTSVGSSWPVSDTRYADLNVRKRGEAAVQAKGPE